MAVADNNALPCHEIPGIVHKTLAGPEHGMREVEVWEQWIEPGGATPVHRHACEEVIVILEGSGECLLEGAVHPLTPNSTLRVPFDAVHQLRNTGSQPMHLLASLTASPVEVRTADGEPLPLPWQGG